MRLSVIGAGYVGLAGALAFAQAGHDVVLVERDAGRLSRLRRREDPLGEPGVRELLQVTSARFVDRDRELDRADLVLVAVGTPMGADGRADLTHVFAACREIREGARPGAVVAVRSTVPVGTCDRLQMDILRSQLVVSNPEFLREGSALADSMAPTRIVAGGPAAARAVIEQLYAPICERAEDATPFLWMSSRSAELSKYAANGFLATKLSFVNEVANLADAVGAEAADVLGSMALDPRIGAGHLRPGLGWGGSCFPKDTRALAALASGEGYDFIVLKAAIEQNNRQLERFAEMIEGETRATATIGLLGLSFKAGTADTRESPALALGHRLVASGRRVNVYDPAVREAPSDWLGPIQHDAYSACADADAVVVATDWPEFADLDLVALREITSGDLLVDGRGMLDPQRARAAGFRYRGVGSIGRERAASKVGVIRASADTKLPMWQTGPLIRSG